VNIVLQSQPHAGSSLPVIFDIAAVVPGPAGPEDWPWIDAGIQSARGSINLVFWNALTDKCLRQYQPM